MTQEQDNSPLAQIAGDLKDPSEQSINVGDYLLENAIEYYCYNIESQNIHLQVLYEAAKKYQDLAQRENER